MSADPKTPGAARPGELEEGDFKPYAPSEQDKALIADIEAKFERWRGVRKPHEVQWYLNAAFFRGQQYVYWHETDNRLATPQAPARRVRLPINRLQAKVRARLAKFLRNRPQPVVVPASTDFKARQDAKTSTKALEYAWQKLRLEVAYRQSLQWAGQTDHGLWWIYWDGSRSARIQTVNPLTGQKEVVEQPNAGDVAVEVGSPFELLVADPTQGALADQPEIMRIKLRAVADIRARYTNVGVYVKADTTLSGGEPGERYEQKIGSLTTGAGGIGEQTASEGDSTHVVVKEWFERPSPDFPKGRYAVVASGVLLKYQEELPYGFHDLPNPYPVVDFQDFLQVGQFWGTTILEQLIPLQKEYNLMRSKVAEHLRMMAYPKVLAAVQHRIPPGAWTTDPGELVEYLAHPNIPPPIIVEPRPIAADVWKSTETLKTEFDDISHVYPEAEGRVGGSSSGFQTNLLQEATDQVHAPDIRAHELAIEEAAWKIRRLMKMGYGVPRLLTVAGKDMQPDVFEFSAEDIDENAEIRVQAGSALPLLKGARIQSIMELYNAGLIGDPADPETRRRATSMLELGTADDAYDFARRDEDQARVENNTLAETAQPLHVPDFWENHAIHYRIHTDLLKGAQAATWQPQQRGALIEHVIRHVKFQNPAAAIQLAMQYGMPQIVADLVQQQQQSQIAGGIVGQPPPGAPPQTPDGAKAAAGGGFPKGKPPGPAGPPQNAGQAQSGNNSASTGFGAKGTEGSL